MSELHVITAEVFTLVISLLVTELKFVRNCLESTEELGSNDTIEEWAEETAGKRVLVCPTENTKLLVTGVEFVSA